MPPSVFLDEEGRRVILVPVKEPSEMVGRKYIAERLGVSNSVLSRSPWHFPDFGERVYGHKDPRPYSKKDVDDWLAIPARRRRAMYMEWRSRNEAEE